MTQKCKRRPGGGGAAVVLLSGELSQHNDADLLRQDVRFHQACRRLHVLGPRPLGEALLELAGAEDNLFEMLERYASLDPGQVRALGGADWPAPWFLAVPK